MKNCVLIYFDMIKEVLTKQTKQSDAKFHLLQYVVNSTFAVLLFFEAAAQTNYYFWA